MSVSLKEAVPRSKTGRNMLDGRKYPAIITTTIRRIGETIRYSTKEGVRVMLFLQGATYPLELLGDADRLAKEAAKHPCQDGRAITTPEERTFARSAIFTAFNFLESLLVELAQSCLSAGGVNPVVQAEIEADLKTRPRKGVTDRQGVAHKAG